MGTLFFISVRSGSFGNGYLVSDGETTLLIDAGIPKKLLFFAAENARIPLPTALFLSHEHSDHTKTLSTLLNSLQVQVYSTRGTWEAISPKLTPLVDEPGIIRSGEEIAVQKFGVSAFRTKHDAAEPVAYHIRHSSGKSVAIVTDLGTFDRDILNFVSDANILLIEANYDPTLLKKSSYPGLLKARIAGDYGHLSNHQCARFLAEFVHPELEHIILGHLSENNNSPLLALMTVLTEIDFPEISVAHRYKPTFFSTRL